MIEMVSRVVPEENKEWYRRLPFVEHQTLTEKVNDLLDGHTILLRSIKQVSDEDLLIKMETKKYTLVRASPEIKVQGFGERAWTVFNVGLNDLALCTSFRFSEDTFGYNHKYHIGDIIRYIRADNVADTAVIQDVYVLDNSPDEFVYRLSGEDDSLLFYEEDLKVAHE